MAPNANSTTAPVMRLSVAGFSLFSVVVQFYLLTVASGLDFPESVWRFFSFFTIITNLLVATAFCLLVAAPASALGKLWAKPVIMTALTVYMTFLAIIYHLLLRNLWNPQGLQWVNDLLLHTVNPLLLLLYWWFYVPKNTLKWHFPVYWLSYPSVYLIWVFFRGAVSGFYPYPFLNVAALGYAKTLLNIGFLSAGLLVFGFIHLIASKISSK